MFLPVASLRADVYVLIYATSKINNGHAAIAIDKYDIQVGDHSDRCITANDDTVATGQLLYFELMPSPAVTTRKHFSRDLMPNYTRYPVASSQKRLDLFSVLHQGTPYKRRIPPDGVIRLATRPADDYRLVKFLDSLCDGRHPFNSRFFNCADFLSLAISALTGHRFSAKEFVPFSFCSTPNKIFRKLAAWKYANTSVLKDPGRDINHSFLMARVIPQLRRKILHQNVNY